MSDDTNTELMERSVELADILGDDYIEEVARLIQRSDLQTLAIFKRDMERIVKLYDQGGSVATEQSSTENNSKEGEK